MGRSVGVKTSIHLKIANETNGFEHVFNWSAVKIFYVYYCKTMLMKTRSTTFRTWPNNQKRLEVASQLGLNVSELINEVLESRFDAVLQEKSKKIQSALKMVRGGGFEPPTPTVSR